MLTQEFQEHLSHDELLQALVDKTGLGEKRRSHLDRCASCREDLERVQHRFGQLGQMARQLAPVPSKPFRLPQKAASRSWLRFAPLWATGLIAAVVFAFAVSRPPQMDRSAPIAGVAHVNQTGTGYLLENVDALVDNALPPVLQQLAITGDMEESDGLIDWVVPSIDMMDDDDSWT